MTLPLHINPDHLVELALLALVGAMWKWVRDQNDLRTNVNKLREDFDRHTAGVFKQLRAEVNELRGDVRRMQRAMVVLATRDRRKVELMRRAVQELRRLAPDSESIALLQSELNEMRERSFGAEIARQHRDLGRFEDPADIDLTHVLDDGA